MTDDPKNPIITPDGSGIIKGNENLVTLPDSNTDRQDLMSLIGIGEQIPNQPSTNNPAQNDEQK